MVEKSSVVITQGRPSGVEVARNLQVLGADGPCLGEYLTALSLKHKARPSWALTSQDANVLRGGNYCFRAFWRELKAKALKHSLVSEMWAQRFGWFRAMKGSRHKEGLFTGSKLEGIPVAGYEAHLKPIGIALRLACKSSLGA